MRLYGKDAPRNFVVDAHFQIRAAFLGRVLAVLRFSIVFYKGEVWELEPLFIFVFLQNCILAFCPIFNIFKNLNNAKMCTTARIFVALIKMLEISI